MDFLETRSDDSIRKEIRGIRDSYHHYWDLLAELLQNSRDAINRKRKAGGVGPFFILITVDASNNRIEVQDNGTGIPKSLIHEMLAPGGGDKDGTGGEVGEKGVGLTYVVFSGDKFSIESRVVDGPVAGGLVEGAQSWLNKNHSKRPVFSPFESQQTSPLSITIDGSIFPIDSYTKISVGGILPAQSDINIFNMTEPQLRLLLRTRTAVGVTKSMFDASSKDEFDVYLSVNLPTGSAIKKVEAKYIAPHSLLAKSNLVSLDDVKQAFLSRSDLASRRKFLGGKSVWTTTKSVVNAWEINVYGVMLTDNEAFRALSKTTLGVESTEDDESNGTALFQSGIYVGTKGMPTGMRIAPKSGGVYPAYYRRCFFFVESEALKFDLGRKSLHYQYVSRLQSAVATIFADFEKIATYQGDAKVDPGAPQTTKAERMQLAQENWAAAEALPELGDPAIQYKKHPNNQEAAVAAVFHELVGAKILNGYKTISTGYSTQYDLHAHYSSPGRQDIKCILEFKHDLETLIRDLEDKKKNFQEIDLLVAWDADETKLKKAGFDLKQVHGNIYDGVTHMLSVPVAGIDEIPVILLRNFIFLRNTMASQASTN